MVNSIAASKGFTDKPNILFIVEGFTSSCQTFLPSKIRTKLNCITVIFVAAQNVSLRAIAKFVDLRVYDWTQSSSLVAMTRCSSCKQLRNVSLSYFSMEYSSCIGLNATLVLGRSTWSTISLTSIQLMHSDHVTQLHNDSLIPPTSPWSRPVQTRILSV